MKVSQGFARVRDGTRIGYSVNGDPGASCAAVLVHSLAMDRHFWDAIAARLAAEAAVLTYDCRGHGASGAGGKAYSVSQFADDLADLMTELRWEKALVGGASLGGCVALAFAERYPQRVAGLGLMDTTAWYGEDAPAQWEGRARAKHSRAAWLRSSISRSHAGSATNSARRSRSSSPRPWLCS